MRMIELYYSDVLPDEMAKQLEGSYDQRPLRRRQRNFQKLIQMHGVFKPPTK